MIRLLCLVVAVGAASVGAAREAAPAAAAPPQATPAPRPATIRGRVVDATTGKPLAMVRMRLTSTARGVPERHTRTNSEGRYEFRDLPPGRVTISAAKARFVTLQHGQELPATAGTPIDVAPGALLERIDFSLPRAAAITGRVVDEYGDAVERASVQAMASRYVEGKRRLTSIAGAMTNDAGEYRIHALQPGAYYVVAAEHGEGFGQPLDADIGFLKTAYPSATTLAQARTVDVTAGRDTSGIDVALVPAAAARITGTVLGPDGQALGGIRLNVRAVGDGPGAGVGGEVVSRPDGTFTLPRMVPGRYEVHARGRTTRFVGAIVPLVVGGDAEIVVPVTHGGRMAGTVIPPEGTNEKPGALVIGATPVGDTFVFGTGFGGPIKDDWTFDWDFLLGGRLVRARTLPDGWYLKSVYRGDQDVIDTPIVFKSDETITDLRLMLANDAATLSGTATASAGSACARCTVVVFADDASRWTYPSRFIHTAVPDQHNAFTFERLVPARYLVVTLEGLHDGDAADPELLERVRQRATEVDLTSARTAVVSLKVVKP